MYGEQGEHKHVFKYKSARNSEHLVITVPHKKTWGTENPSESPGNAGCSPRSPVPPFIFHSDIWAMAPFKDGDAMSLLSGLLDHMAPPLTNADNPLFISSDPDRPPLALVSRLKPSDQRHPSTYTNAADATPEWRHVRDQYINHVMACRSCYAPTSRYCPAGADLRAIYDATPMESHQ